MKHVEKRYLLLFMPENHKDRVEELVPLSHPVDEYCVFENAFLGRDAEWITILHGCQAKAHHAVATQSCAYNVVVDEGPAEVKRSDEFHEMRGSHAHDQVDP